MKKHLARMAYGVFTVLAVWAWIAIMVHAPVVGFFGIILPFTWVVGSALLD